MFNWLRDIFLDKPAPVVMNPNPTLLADSTRARPGQSLDAINYLYAPSPNTARLLPYYALNIWVYTAVSRLVEAASGANLHVHSKKDISKENPTHPLLDLLGVYGVPNEGQDSLEFLEEHLGFYELTGNSYWFWTTKDRRGGIPDEVYVLDPTNVFVVPGRNRSVDGYMYRHMGHEYKLDAARITHFKKFNPYNPYYGLSALEACTIEATSDRNMALWNADFFGDGVSIPAGIFVIPDDVNDTERDRLDKEINAKHSERRRTAIIRAKQGGTVWHDGGLKQRDLDFENGRLLHRRAIMDALGLPLGLMSEASTEAHARVAERQYYGAVQKRLTRTERKINSDAMYFWSNSDKWFSRYEDMRQAYADWDQTSKKLESMGKLFTVDEIRAREFGAGAKPSEAEVAAVSAAPAPAAASQDNQPSKETQNAEQPAGD